MENGLIEEKDSCRQFDDVVFHVWVEICWNSAVIGDIVISLHTQRDFI